MPACSMRPGSWSGEVTVAVFSQTVTHLDQLPMLIEQAANAAIQDSGVAVLTLPGDVGGLDLPKGTAVPRFVTDRPPAVPSHQALARAAAAVNDAGRVTLLVGQGARHARAEVLELAERLSAPMVITLKGKEGLEHDNPYEVGQSGLLGNHASAVAFDGCDLLLMVGTDFPYKEFFPKGKAVVQLDANGTHIGRRTPVDHPVVGDARLGLQALLPMLEPKPDRDHLDKARSSYDAWRERQQQFLDPGYDRKPKGLLRRKVDNPDSRIRPELLAALVDRYAADDAGQGQHRDAPLVEGGVAGLLDEARQLVRRGDGRGEDSDVGEERVVVDLLEEVRADLPARHLATDGEHRGVGLLRVVQTVEQVDGAGADGAHADGEPVGELGLRAGRERPRLLVPHPDPLDALLAADRVGDGVERVAHHSPHLGHAVVGEGVDQQLGNGGHATPVRG